jgi:hypothetical protein
MKRAPLFLVLFGFLIVFAGCKKPVSDADAIRSGINAHLSGLKTINLSAMDMTVNSFSIQGDKAQAQVEFHPKNGAPQGAGMQVNYTLEKQNGMWVVAHTEPAGGMIQHPAPGENPNQSMTSGSSSPLPNFSNLVGGGSGSTLPPGHPAANPQGNSGSDTPSYNNPH